MQNKSCRSGSACCDDCDSAGPRPGEWPAPKKRPKKKPRRPRDERGGSAAKLSVKKDPDEPPDDEAQAAVDAINDAIENADSGNIHKLEKKLKRLVDDLLNPPPPPPPPVDNCPWPISECGNIPPPPPSEDGSTRGMDPSFEGLNLVGNGWPTDGCARDFIGTVWAFLQQNVDLVEWACCMAGLSDRMTDCILDQINGDNMDRVRVKLEPCLPQRPDGAMWFTGGDTILICSDNAKWNQALSAWCDPCATQADKDCAVINISCSFLHEVSHTCGSSDEHPEPWCAESYKLGNAFGVAALSRYPNASSSPCCDSFTSTAGVRPGNADGIKNVNLDCVVPCTPPGGGGGTSGGPYPYRPPPTRDEVQLVTPL